MSSSAAAAPSATSASSSHHHKPSFSRYTTPPAGCSTHQENVLPSPRDESPETSNCSSPDGSRSSSRRRDSFGSIKEDVDGKFLVEGLRFKRKILNSIPRRRAVLCRHPYRPPSERRTPQTQRFRNAPANPRLLLPLRWLSRLEANSPRWKESESELQ